MPARKWFFVGILYMIVLTLIGYGPGCDVPWASSESCSQPQKNGSPDWHWERWQTCRCISCGYLAPAAVRLTSNAINNNMNCFIVSIIFFSIQEFLQSHNKATGTSTNGSAAFRSVMASFPPIEAMASVWDWHYKDNLYSQEVSKSYQWTGRLYTWGVWSCITPNSANWTCDECQIIKIWKKVAQLLH